MKVINPQITTLRCFLFKFKSSKKKWKLFCRHWFVCHFLSCNYFVSCLPIWFSLIPRIRRKLHLPRSHSRCCVVGFWWTLNSHFWKLPVFLSLKIKSMVEDAPSFRILYWEKEDEPGILWANKRTMLGIALPRVDPMCSPSWKLVDALPFWLLPFGLSLGSVCHKGQMPGEHLVAGLCFLASLFSWERNKHAALCQMSMAPMSTLYCSCLSGMNKPIGILTSLLALFSHPFPTLFLFSHLIFCHLSLIVSRKLARLLYPILKMRC